MLNFSVMFEDTETANVSLGDNRYFDVQLLTEDRYTFEKISWGIL